MVAGDPPRARPPSRRSTAIGGSATSASRARRFLAWQSSTPVPSLEDDSIERVILQSQRDLGSLRIFDPCIPSVPSSPPARRGSWRCSGATRCSPRSWRCRSTRRSPSARCARSPTCRARESMPPPRSSRDASSTRCGSARRRTSPWAEARSTTARPTPRRCSSWYSASSLAGAACPTMPTTCIEAADRALEWIERYGDRDGDGFVEYARLNQHGLINQGWKDSWDGITFADGSLARPPIALCEVQGYVYAAFLARATLAASRGDRRDWRHRLEERAAELKREFNERFWLPDRGYFALALDADKRPVDSCTSNMGHCLWTGIVDDDKAPAVAERLLSDELFTGWGVRTLATDMGAYNPASYHNGSVWPHDNAIVAAGLMRYGFVEEANRIVFGMFDAATRSTDACPSCSADSNASGTPSRSPIRHPAPRRRGPRRLPSRCCAPRSASTRRCPPATSGSRRPRPSTSATSTCATCRSPARASPWTPHAMAPPSSASRPASPCTRCHALYRLRCPFEGTRHENRHHRTTVDSHPADRVRRHRVVHRHACARARTRPGTTWCSRHPRTAPARCRDCPASSRPIRR